MSERVLVTGASGQLGAYLLRELARRETPAVGWGRRHSGPLSGTDVRPVELTDADAVAAAFRDARPTHVIHAAAMAAVGDCARDPAGAHAVNAVATGRLAGLAAAAGARFVQVSTDLVFDGERGGYAEDDAPAPLSVYGRTKAAAERVALAFPGHAVVRVSLLFGPTLTGRPAFFDHQLAALRAGRPLTLFHDEWRTPLDLDTAAGALVAIARSDVAGVLHVGGPERMSRLDMGRRLAACLGLDPAAIVPSSRESAAGEPRPRDVALDSRRWRALFPAQPWPGFEDAVRALTAA